MYETYCKFSCEKFFKSKNVETLHPELLRLKGIVYSTLDKQHLKIWISKNKLAMTICYQQQSGTLEACWAHNPEVSRLKLTPAILVKKLLIFRQM